MCISTVPEVSARALFFVARSSTRNVGSCARSKCPSTSVWVAAKKIPTRVVEKMEQSRTSTPCRTPCGSRYDATNIA